MIIEFNGKSPKIGKNVFIAPDAWVIGNVEIGDEVSIFFGAVIRGDIMPIKIGARSNIQEHCVIHTSVNQSAVNIGSGVTVGHRAIIHGATIKDNSLVGMGSIVLDGAIVESECLIGANSLIAENKIIPTGSLAVGSPARVLRVLTNEEKQFFSRASDHYVEKGLQYIATFSRLP